MDRKVAFPPRALKTPTPKNHTTIRLGPSFSTHAVLSLTDPNVHTIAHIPGPLPLTHPTPIPPRGVRGRDTWGVICGTKMGHIGALGCIIVKGGFSI